jgi:response regulator of citrate/malate metabolism
VRDRIKRELKEALTPISQRREQLEAELRDLAVEEEEYTSALAALNGEALRSTRKKPQASATTTVRKTHRVGEATLTEVHGYFSEKGEATATQASEDLGISESAVRAAIANLRDDERLRITGTRRSPDDPRGGAGKPPNLYGVMP